MVIIPAELEAMLLSKPDAGQVLGLNFKDDAAMRSGLRPGLSSGQQGAPHTPAATGRLHHQIRDPNHGGRPPFKQANVPGWS